MVKQCTSDRLPILVPNTKVSSSREALFATQKPGFFEEAGFIRTVIAAALKVRKITGETLR